MGEYVTSEYTSPRLYEVLETKDERKSLQIQIAQGLQEVLLLGWSRVHDITRRTEVVGFIWQLCTFMKEREGELFPHCPATPLCA